MSRTVLYPMVISVKLVPPGADGKPQSIAVPALPDASLGSGVATGPFNTSARLETGAHVHWALPDALTRAELLSDPAKSQGAVFAAVPDLWLVIRFNAGRSSANPAAKRTWKAWVVDSVAGAATPLAGWTQPTRDVSKVHTFAGMLPDGAPVNRSGKGFLQSTAKQDADPRLFNPYMAAYYPATRKRFGLWDDLQGVPLKGHISYLVIGWHSSDHFDPVTAATDPYRILNDWLARPAALSSGADLRPSVDLTSLSGSVHTGQPSPPAGPGAGVQPIVWKGQVQVRGVPALSADRLQNTRRMVARSGNVDRSRSLFQSQISQFTPGRTAPVTSLPALTREVSATIYHGAAVSVDLSATGLVPGAPITNDMLALYPDVQYSITNTASAAQDDKTLGATEKVVSQVKGQNSSTGGVMDMPAATHAATFQNVPGAARVFLRVDVAPPVTDTQSSTFSMTGANDLSGMHASGYWPDFANGSGPSVKKNYGRPDSVWKTYAGTSFTTATTDQKTLFRNDVMAAFQAAQAALKQANRNADPNLIYVYDARKNARSLHLGETTKGTGSDTGAWWVDVNVPGDLDALLRTTRGARVSMPSATYLHEIPGPRWYKPWAPQLVVSKLKRSYKFGFDGRYSPDGTVAVRRSGETLSSIRVGDSAKVSGSQLLDNEAGLNVAGLPPDTIALAREALLMDAESAGIMGGNKPGDADRFAAAITKRIADNASAANNPAQADTSTNQPAEFTGTQPSPLAVSPWSDPTDPLFADIRYSIDAGFYTFTLVESDVEKRVTATNGPGMRTMIADRSQLTLTVPATLKSVTAQMGTSAGQGGTGSGGNIAHALDTLDVMSASLQQLDLEFAPQHRLRQGQLKLEQLSVVDMFGQRREYSAPSASNPQDQSTPITTILTPRYPFWARYGMRLQSAQDNNVEATPQAGPICGMLVPDFVEHTLEVFNANGDALGQLVTDAPFSAAIGKVAPTNLAVKYVPHPWVKSAPNNPYLAIDHPVMRNMVQSIALQSYSVPADAKWAETGLSAMLRVIDTVRTTFDPASKPNSHRVDLIGTPILVMVARLGFTATETQHDESIGEGTAEPISSPPYLPWLQVRVGDAIRPDDGVLGIFVPDFGLTGEGLAGARFAPVSKEAAQNALLPATNVHLSGKSNTQQVEHPFVTGSPTHVVNAVSSTESVVTITGPQPVDVILLADPGLSIYATCGVLPRKKIDVPREFTDAVLGKLSPSFYAGPVLAVREEGGETPLVPPPEVTGYVPSFFHREPDTQTNAGSGATTWTPSPMRAMPPLGELPVSRVQLTEGWVQLTKASS